MVRSWVVVVLGAALGQPAATHLGWHMLWITVGVATGRLVLAQLLERGGTRRWRRIVRVAGALVAGIVAVLALVGAVRTNTVVGDWV